MRFVYFVFVLLITFSNAAFALIPKQTFQGYTLNGDQFSTNPKDYCSTGTLVPRSDGSYACDRGPNATGYVIYIATRQSCPANSSPSGDQCSCNAGYKEKNNQCVPETQCTSGESLTLNIPIGWATYYTGNSGTYPVDGGGSATPIGSPSPPASVCSGGCSYSSGAWTGNLNLDAPSGSGSYQIVATTTLTGSGTTCTQNTDLTAPPNPAPPCSGDVGYVNGKQYCAASQPTTGGSTGGTTGGTGGSTGGSTGEGGSTGGDSGGSTGGTGGSTGGSTGGTTGGSTGSGTGSGTGTSGDGDGEGEGEGQGGSGTAPALGKWTVPKFYETKYPNGLDDAWTQSGIDTASQTFKSLANAFVPPWSDTKGQCQSFSLNVDVGIVNFGRLDFSPPCSVWFFIWLCMQISAIFLFRALVFGG